MTLPPARVGGAPLGDSFALMYSCEDPSTPLARNPGTGAQAMGPGDGYLCRHSRSTGVFWAHPHRLELGAAFASAPGAQPPRGLLSEDTFQRTVLEGFQASATWHQARRLGLCPFASGQRC